MATRRSLRKEQEPPQKRRRSLRLESKKNPPFGNKRTLAYQGTITSKITDCRTPRTLFKKVLQTLPVTSPLASVKPDITKPTEPVVQFPSEHISSSDLEINLSDSASQKTCRISLLKTKSKKICLSEFEKCLNEQLDPNTVHSSLENTSLTKSLQISFKTPAPLPAVGKKGLIRRPKNYRGINVKDFEGGIEQNLLNINESQSGLLSLQAATFLSSDGDLTAADTELFAPPLPHGENGEEGSDAPSQRTAARLSLSRGSTARSNPTPLPTSEKPGVGFGVSERSQKDVLESETGSADEPESMSEEKVDGPAEVQSKKLQGTVEERGCIGDAGETEAIPHGKPFTSGNANQENLHGNSPAAQLLSLPEEYPATDTCRVRMSTPLDAKFSDVYPGDLSTLSKEKPARQSVKEMVAKIIEDLDRSVVPAVIGQGISEANLLEEPNERTIHVLQTCRATSRDRGVCGKNPGQLERSSRKKTDKIIPQETDGGKTSEVMDTITKHDIVSEAELDPESEEVSETDADFENAEPTEKTPAFVRARAFQCTPLLSTPQAQKMSVPRSPYVQPSVKQVRKAAKRERSSKCEPALPSSLVKNIFNHYVRMPVTKDAFKAVQRCVNLYFRNLSDDLEAYTNHARRKTTESADLELLMRRQGLITDKMPLNVLIERHLPLEYRKLLIPVATTGNKVL
ncbi:hypothetical protein JRQ81_006272 [Phrynocephalus forsythii]|uniref:Centromere protein T n=1 Tax=Phrynocephalus forsythii TaxID=171643 RepID=A0A9Q0XHP9_9SAUR|nr:hypothetical protein JRQ81_006272 [Phrynocephalus forsythii]